MALSSALSFGAVLSVFLGLAVIGAVLWIRHRRRQEELAAELTELTSELARLAETRRVRDRRLLANMLDAASRHIRRNEFSAAVRILDDVRAILIEYWQRPKEQIRRRTTNDA